MALETSAIKITEMQYNDPSLEETLDLTAPNWGIPVSESEEGYDVAMPDLEYVGSYDQAA